MIVPSTARGEPSAPPASSPGAAPGSPAAVPVEPAPTEVAERPPLTVLNHSKVKGLAARAAEDFTRGGWQVVEVANTRYAVARTTVYFVPGQEAAAAALRRQFPSILRSAPRPAELPGSGLTVVVTREYPH